MAGIRKGVQAEIMKIQPKALYVRCYAHSLNTVLKNADEVKPFQSFLTDVNRVGKFFSTAKRRDFFLNLSGCPKGTVVPQVVCATRWTSYAEVTSAAAKSSTYLVDAFEMIHEDMNWDKESRIKAGDIRDSMLTYEFAFCLAVRLSLSRLMHSLLSNLSSLFFF